ncbi:hypothetical protein EI94DRAFT_1797234 [Lactarius quietus]|nr:hypothetical protein EI94DRAFT_1797234 [Lactarius quietus]
MPFRKHDPRRRAQANGVHLSTSSASLSSFSSSSDSSFLPAAPPSGSSQSDLPNPDHSVHTSPTSAHKSHLPPDTILPVPRSSSLIPAMGQIPSRSQFQHSVPPPSPTLPEKERGLATKYRSYIGSSAGGNREKSLRDDAGVLDDIVTVCPQASASTNNVCRPQLSHIAIHPQCSTRAPVCFALSWPSTGESHPKPAVVGSSRGNVIQRPMNRDSDHDVTKEDWRKSDSTTTSYYTVRPRSVASAGTRTPRPVSMAESLHSTNTVVPAGKRLSALLTDAEFVMTEEDSTGSHIKGNLTALTTPPPTAYAVPQQLPPSQHGSLRQTAISMTSGLAPAAGIAMGFGKRAVERVGRAFGSLGTSHNTSGHSSSSSSISGTDDSGRNASDLSLASHASQAQANKGKPRRTPNAPSVLLAQRLAPAFDGRCEQLWFHFIGGLVFGRDLKTCAEETAIDAIRLAPRTSGSSHTVSPALHERRLPALVFRCAQHLMKWGVEEEGLFRVSGRATHVAKLRSEFDTGADFDMLECAPGDLDPHAVASVFKTYLRELPEPILTHALNPYFEAAMLTETNARKSIEEQGAPVRKLGGRGPSLPSGPRDGPLRKAPSLSTLALPNFSGMRPPSQPLLNTFASLLARLPQENRDLLRTIIDVINFVVQRKEIRMPLSNLTLVLCPTLNMNPPIFRVLCEAEGIWNGPPDDWVDDSTDLDMNGDT